MRRSRGRASWAQVSRRARRSEGAWTEVTIMKEMREEKPYPPPPWISDGQMWTGVYPVTSPPALPEGLRPFLDPSWVLLVFVRYLAGTLRYDELVIGSLARRGLRVGIYVHDIWVDSEASLRGGRRIWGLPKELATFAWEGDTVHVADAEGPIATLSVDRSPAPSPRIWTIAPGFGRL